MNKRKLTKLLSELLALNTERKRAYTLGPLHSADVRQAARERMTRRRKIKKELNAMLGKKALNLLNQLAQLEDQYTTTLDEPS